MLWIKQKELNTNFVALVEILQDQDSNSNLHSSIVIIFAPLLHDFNPKVICKLVKKKGLKDRKEAS